MALRIVDWGRHNYADPDFHLAEFEPVTPSHYDKMQLLAVGLEEATMAQHC